MIPTVSVQGYCRSVNDNNSKGENDLGQSILETNTFFWWTVNQEEGLIGV